MAEIEGCYRGLDGKYYHGKKWMPAMYVAYFGIFQELANQHGYALCIHGSVTRDFDLVAVPFDNKVSSHAELLTAMREAIGITESSNVLFDIVGNEPHGRTCYTVECGGGGYLDISFTPTLEQALEQARIYEKKKQEMEALIAEMDLVQREV